MNNISNPNSTELSKPVDRATAAVLRAVHVVGTALNHEFLLVGATARDLLLVNALGLPPTRATRDIDFGIAIRTWDEFTAFKDRLIASRSFHADSRQTQRVYYKNADERWELPVDMIPFGPIASEEGTIAWPPSRDIVMNVAGFEDALRSSLRIRVEDDLVVRVASIPGLTILKLFAWSDRGGENSKDASDLYTLLSTYADAGNLDRLYEHEVDLLEKVEFDVILAGAQLLGRDVARICETTPSRRIREALDGSRGAADLVSQMNRAHDPFGERPQLAHNLLERFLWGVAE
jgi:predicted nucleotidyltransferase